MQKIIKELLSHEGGVCISLTVPTQYTSFADKDKVRIMLKNGLHKIDKELEKNYDKPIQRSLSSALHTLLEEVDLNHPPQGIAAYVTDGYSKLVHLPFAVKEKVVISDTFEIQDILFNLDQLIHYHVLLLSQKHTRLFEGLGLHIREIENEAFPKAFEDPYEEDKPAYHALHTKDLSHVSEKRVETFLRSVHHAVAPYIHKHPLVLMGIDKYISTYKSFGKPHELLGEIHANHDKLPVHELNKLVAPVIEAYQHTQEEALCQTIQQKIGRKEAVHGVEEVLQALETAHKMHLVVHKDYEVKGYLDRQGKLTRHQIDPLHDQEIPNLVEHIIEKVLKHKQSHVTVVSCKEIQAYDQIVLITKPTHSS